MTSTDREQPLGVRIGQTATPEQVRRLVRFAWGCVRNTPLSGFRDRRRLRDALRAVGRWLEGEPVGELLRAMHDDVFEAALGAGRFEPDMTGSKAACWSVFEVYLAALTAEQGDFQTAARKAASAAVLACRSGDDAPTPDAVDHQERLLREALAP